MKFAYIAITSILNTGKAPVRDAKVLAGNGK